ncbi:NTF2 fold immunity protein [Silvibacterium sp.]|uniref:NTF2 fold immunity protein n=1 Tax=Silvibacterium sp. TaxID=1964179 RepID=UPI0039E58861
MKQGRTRILVIGSLLLAGTLAAQTTVSDDDWIEYDRRLAEHAHLSIPASGLIPDQATAAAVAAAIAVPIWGKDVVSAELPLKARLKGNVWTVIGDPHLHGGETGGELIIQLDRRTGAVLSFLHTQ